MRKEVTAVFDIGKTNKKFFLFDSNFQEVYREYTKFDPIVDEDGHPTEDLDNLQQWLKDLFHEILEAKEYEIKAINFSSYGASFVHLDENGEAITPIYNYTKPIPKWVIEKFFEKYGPVDDFCARTGSSNEGMLNSGIQLFWLKYAQPDVFKRIRYSLHLPQYLSFIFTGIPLSEYTSIGCHTSLWDYEKKDYHSWVYQEGLHTILPPIVSTETSINMNYNGKRIKIGVGIHDSSSALLPYVRSLKEPFILVSTGTWSISLNPFATTPLSEEDIKSNCIFYMRINGKAVKASRLFLGNEYQLQVRKLDQLYHVSEDYHRQILFDENLFHRLSKDLKPMFRWEYLENQTEMPYHTINFPTYEEAYHQLMIELVLLQVKSITIASGGMHFKNLYVDGGFTKNDVYINLLTHYLRDMELRTTDASLGSALGAAICISDTELNSKFLKENYALKKHVPLIIK
ncbi:FGGY-family carbohydrate kinase [Robertkochia solimangrovi]|uniref:FGGY-family carbohydrate kinase n=1 Tax=Robertkochia solimangrovi TaxID=2213046 RepID=UPI00117ED620|nr:FGGY family carbohydrate kinase [Robertkochia solimangrovi]TRZ45050.1 carbohydrate kinase [Robertkochia solimangrovi]